MTYNEIHDLFVNRLGGYKIESVSAPTKENAWFIQDANDATHAAFFARTVVNGGEYSIRLDPQVAPDRVCEWIVTLTTPIAVTLR